MIIKARSNKMRKRITVLFVAIAVACMATIHLQAQEATATRAVSGTVTDDSGEPLVGATVTIKGTTTGVLSDSDGTYSIDVPENAILRFQYLGFVDQDITVDSQQVNCVMVEDEFTKGLQPAQAIKLTSKQREKAEADNRVAFQFFREVAKQEGENVLFSPFSLNMILGMLYNGASGDTRDEMIQALGLADFSDAEINEYYQKIAEALLRVDPTTALAVANSIWYRDSFSAKSDFVEIGKEYFEAEVQALDFGNSNAAGTINRWVADQTNNRIKQIVGASIPDGLMMYLVNAVYFKSKWQQDVKFDQEDTKQDTFTKTNDQKKKVNMMEQTSFLAYYTDEHLQLVELDYGNRAFSMVAVLPSKDKHINQLIDYLDNEKWGNALNQMKRQKVWLKLPRFKIENDFLLDELTRKSGMGKIFTGGFNKISDDDLFVSNIRQKTFVEVNEEGTEAAAATSVVMIGFGRQTEPVEPVRFFGNRPFLYLIREKSTGAILFIGRVDDPLAINEI